MFIFSCFDAPRQLPGRRQRALPDPDDLGLGPDVVITNAATVQDDLLFISNGEASVYEAVGAQSLETSACADTQMVEVLGQLQFGSLESVNYVS